MLTDRILMIIGATAITVAVFAFISGPTGIRVLVGGIILVGDIIVILSLRRPRAPGQHPHSANR
jgi:methylglyoxal synthase